MNVKWTEVTRISQLIAIILAGAIFYVGFSLGGRYTKEYILGVQDINGKPIVNTVSFFCRENKVILAQFKQSEVALNLSDNRSFNLPQTVAASGARFANSDESFVFWTKGMGAFIEEKGQNTYTDCTVMVQTRKS